MQNILIIDDDRDICHVLSRFLVKNNYSVSIAHNGEQGLSLLRSSHFDLILCDYRLPDQNGIELLQKIKILNSTVAIIMISAYPNVKTAVESFRYGANDYITKPFYPDELLASIKETISKNSLIASSVNGGQGMHKKINGSVNHSATNNFIIGKSTQSLTVQRHIELIAPSDITVIINGETGTGKEFVAQSIHKFSKRSNQPFLAIDCGALPKELTGSELFGHVKGSFTGAISDKPGSFELANNGSIFLDEIGNLTYENQVKLLRVIQERKIKRIGATRDIEIDVRIIVATNENLANAVKEGRLREDLYHRLNEFKIQLAPLRERQNDIMYFASHFLQQANQALNKNVTTFSAAVEDYFMNYCWHGNLRELNNVIRRAVLLTEGQEILSDSLPHEIVQTSELNSNDDAIQENIGMLKSVAWTAERQAIIGILDKVNHNKSKASEILNIDRKTLYNKLKLYNISA